MSRSLEVVTITVDQMRTIVCEAVAKALDDQRRRDQGLVQSLSATRAARFANCRDSYLLSALASGALRGTKTGSRWSITTRDLESWVNAGKPVDR